MRKTQLTYEVILAALTLGATVSEAGCSKAAPVRAEPSGSSCSPDMKKGN